MAESMDTIWLFVMDSRRGRLLRTTRAPAGRHHLDELDALENTREKHQHGRPSRRTGKSTHSYASPGHEDDELLQRYADDAAEWLGKQVAKRDIERVDVFAPIRLLGALRKAYSDDLAVRVEEHGSDLGNLDPGQLQQHPAVLSVLEAPDREVQPN